MKEQTIFPREEKAEVLFQKILNDHWACEKLQETFCNCLFAMMIRMPEFLRQNFHWLCSMRIRTGTCRPSLWAYVRIHCLTC